MWSAFRKKLLSVLSLTLGCLLGSNSATNRPMVKLKLKGSSATDSFLYDSGAQISLLSRKSFRKIAVHKRPKKINFDLTCSGVSGNQLNVLGCYMVKFTLLGKEIEHPLFVVDSIPGQAGVLGIDIIKRFGLGLDVITNKPYLIDQKIEATVTKEVFLPARCKHKCKVQLPSHCIKNAKNNLKILQINIPKCRQIFVDEVLIDPTADGLATIYLTNVSEQDMRLQKGTIIGNVEAVEPKELNPFKVTSTTPFANEKEVAKVKIPILDAARKRSIIKSANLHHLSPDLKDKYLELLLRNHACISLSEFDLGKCTKGSHAIPTKSDAPPTYQKQFPLAYEHEQEIRRQILEWLKIGIIRPCESEYNSSLFLVAKKPPPAQPGEVSPRPKSYRIVQDLRALNKDTLPSNVRLPEIHECLDRIAQKKPAIFSSLDLRSGYFQLPIEKESQEKTAFTSVSLGQQFCFKVTSQGLTSAPASFARTMQRIFSKQIAKNELEVYLDDVLSYAKDHTEMLKTLEEAFKNLIESGMKINIEKCQFGIDKLTYLGFEINKDGYKPDPVKSEGITKVHEPSTLKGVRSFMGMANFYRYLIPKFAQLTKPLTRLTCKGAWTGGKMPECAQKAFRKCQKIFTNRPFLHYPDFNLQFHLYVDASLGDLDEVKEGGLAGCLVQYPNNDITAKVRPIGFCSRGLQKHEKNYSASLIETAGIIFSIEYFEKYLRSRFTVHTDHKPITTIREGKVHRRTLERFREILANYDFKLEWTPGTEMPSDYMSRHVKVDNVNINCKKLYSLLVENNNNSSTSETKQTEKIENCACMSSQKVAQAKSRTKLEPTEKIEDCACMSSQKVAQAKSKPKLEPTLVQSTSRSNLLSHSISSDKEVGILCAGTLKPMNCEPKNESACTSYAAAVKEVKSSTPSTVEKGVELTPNSAQGTTTIVPVADKKMKESAQSFKYKSIKDKISGALKFCAYGVKGKLQKSFNLYDTKVDKNPILLRNQQSIDPFVQAVKYFITHKILPKDRYRNLIKRWGPYCFLKEGLVMMKHSRPGYLTRNLVVAPAERISNIIAESHGSLLGGHDGSNKTVERILQHYWFPGVHSETDFFIENCPTCNRNKKKSKVSNTYLKPLKQADTVFERVHMDLFGPMKTVNGKAYIQTMTDSFSKFSIFKVIKNKDAETVAKCFFDNWVAVFGSPYSIVTDRGTDFTNETLEKVCDLLQIDKKVIATQHPASNAQAEVLNKKLSKYLTYMETEAGLLDWEKMVPSVQYAYNLSVHRALKNSPYSVLFGVDANTPLNHTGFVTTPLNGPDYQHTMGNRLLLARKLAKANNMDFRDDYVKRFNKSVKPHDFQEGMLVFLHRPDLVTVNPKLTTEWFGPFVILNMVNDHNALIQELSNKKTKFVNVNRLRKYHNSISEWKKFKVVYDKNAKEKLTSRTSPKSATASQTAPTAKFAEFESDNDVVCLNPDVQPVPKMSIKAETQDITESFSDHEASDEEIVQQDVDIDQHAGPSTSKEPNPSFGSILTKYVSPRKTRLKAKIYKDPPKEVTLEDLSKIEKSKPKKNPIKKNPIKKK